MRNSGASITPWLWHLSQSQRSTLQDLRLVLSRDDYTMVIDNGKVKATINAAFFDAKPNMRDTLHGELKARFLAIQLLNHRRYELSRPTMLRLRPDRSGDVFIELKGEEIRPSNGLVDNQNLDANGNVIFDSRGERIKKESHLADLISAHSGDGLLGALLESHQHSVHDPNNELVHLYEIREALCKRFGGRKPTQAALRVTDDNWGRFGRLCNDEPLRQGRHRGKKIETLRDATRSELEDARAIARSMIESYLRQLVTRVPEAPDRTAGGES